MLIYIVRSEDGNVWVGENEQIALDCASYEYNGQRYGGEVEVWWQGWELGRLQENRDEIFWQGY